MIKKMWVGCHVWWDHCEPEIVFHSEAAAWQWKSRQTWSRQVFEVKVSSSRLRDKSTRRIDAGAD